jgi:hypothetical protein
VLLNIAQQTQPTNPTNKPIKPITPIKPIKPIKPNERDMCRMYRVVSNACAVGLHGLVWMACMAGTAWTAWMFVQKAFTIRHISIITNTLGKLGTLPATICLFGTLWLCSLWLAWIGLVGMVVTTIGLICLIGTWCVMFAAGQMVCYMNLIVSWLVGWPTYVTMHFCDKSNYSTSTTNTTNTTNTNNTNNTNHTTKLVKHAFRSPACWFGGCDCKGNPVVD